MMHWWPRVGWVGGWIGMMFFWIILIGAVIFLLVRRDRNNSSNVGGNTRPPSRALSILEERYAQGEIEEEEFMRKRRMLREGE